MASHPHPHPPQQDYQATRHIDNPEHRVAHRKTIVASHHFGIPEGLPGGADPLSHIIADLRFTDHLTDQERAWNGNSFIYPAPIAAGLARLQEGSLLQQQLTQGEEL